MNSEPQKLHRAMRFSLPDGLSTPSLDAMFAEVVFQISHVEHDASAKLVVRQPALPDEAADHEDRDAEERRGVSDRYASLSGDGDFTVLALSPRSHTTSI